MLLLTLPGTAFVYQGDEIGLANGPGHDPPFDRMGRDSFRHPMQWDGTRGGGFSTAEPWLPAVDPAARNVAEQSRDPSSLFSFWRSLIALRQELDGPLEMAGAAGDVLVFHRGHVTVAISFADEPRPLPAGDVLLATEPLPARSLPSHAAVAMRALERA